MKWPGLVFLFVVSLFVTGCWDRTELNDLAFDMGLAMDVGKDGAYEASAQIVVPWFIVTGMILRQFSDFVHITLFTRTPLLALVLPFVLLVAYASQKGGIEIIARCSEMIGPMVVIVFAVLIVLNWPNMNVDNILPVYADTGMGTIARGSFPVLSFFWRGHPDDDDTSFYGKIIQGFVGRVHCGRSDDAATFHFNRGYIDDIWTGFGFKNGLSGL